MTLHDIEDKLPGWMCRRWSWRCWGVVVFLPRLCEWSLSGQSWNQEGGWRDGEFVTRTRPIRHRLSAALTLWHVRYWLIPMLRDDEKSEGQQ